MKWNSEWVQQQHQTCLPELWVSWADTGGGCLRGFQGSQEIQEVPNNLLGNDDLDQTTIPHPDAYCSSSLNRKSLA